MNERIKEIAEQSYDTIEFSYAAPQKVFNHRKFAELLVKECAKIAASTPCPYKEEHMIKEFGHTWDMACVSAARDIRNLITGE